MTIKENKIQQDKIASVKAESWKMFNQISGRYDLLNKVFSFGLQKSWRRKLVRFFPQSPDLKVLDVATGTGEVLLTALSMRPDIKTAFGIDLADKMLEIARIKAQQQELEERITFSHGDCNQIPFPDNSFDVVTIAFGIRNMPNVIEALKEIFRILKPAGCILILESSLPENKFIRGIYLFYLRNFIPALGLIVSRSKYAYRYLNETIEDFPYGKDFCKIMSIAGFSNCEAHPLTLGVVTVYEGIKS
ncbi:MAG TPA: bifunctional demethylmenaquinone methyltransferase/2-methoxy-6-polyprenyl-1,4-benzoquinol methylase UbiE [Candidatus Omnitrophota bacterium]|nr:bifunctional demethylmenaquinone methyltransferase/2-methoxy-6-polyprenyl-1,4-benzoquinol methylase UbiE [Candidatus Omnitrophota bacterium]HPD85416.1 bifunctional demethylmenaquinone methyltransferase/2-methoxy-6-polyprenyl-1,4-benzoquinol methylase UbiE [Candidatus Omnitrophota bacterium]HRZ04083.1 bifunctional demethylmenaquinone methyltransferase/2-methoxy-6-polyprenyl-1,4-benzoquinol methylase UbiE [Candidatus Omnitrophota bacterium]